MKKPKPFRIFRVGTHTDSAGNSTTFTREQLAATVTAYNEGDWRAPMVVGHPKGNAPAYGWVGKMRLDDSGDVIVDDVEKLNADFADLMENGAYRNRSASWYAPDHPSNPTPGVWQLRHLGMLGAQPPALKGLGDVEFHDQEGLTVEFADYTTSTIAGLLRGLRELFISKWGTEDADKALPNFLIADLEQAGRDRITETVPDFSDPNPEAVIMTPEEIAALQAKAAQLEADLATTTARATAAETAAANFAEQQRVASQAVAIADAKVVLKPLVDSGKLLPAQLDKAAEFMAGLDDKAKTFDFGEATGDNALTARQFMVKLMEQGQRQVDYNEHTSDVTLPQNQNPSDVAALAVQYQEQMAGKGITVSTAAAVDAVIAGKTA